jgi:hypothetical protein
MEQKNTKDLATKNSSSIADVGEVLYAFHAPEFMQYERGPAWYFVAGVISLVLIAVGILTQSIAFVGAFLLFIAVYFLVHHHDPRLIEIAITQKGIRAGAEFYPFEQIENFWLIDQQPYVADLKLRLKKSFNAVVTLHYFGQDPAQLRELLVPHAAELLDQKENFFDTLTRLARL